MNYKFVALLQLFAMSFFLVVGNYPVTFFFFSLNMFVFGVEIIEALHDLKDK